MTTFPTIQTNPLDPVFSGVPVVLPQTGAINPTWNKWFVDLREKVNVINQTLATLSGGSVDPSTGALAISSGGTGATTVAGAQTNLEILANPMTTAGDIIIGGTGGTPTRLAKGTNGYVLTLVSGIPAWALGGGGGGGFTSPQLIQSAWINTAPSATPSAVFGTSPSAGNLLVCFMFNWTTNTVATGWTQLQHAGTQDYCMIAIKQAGAAESTTQTPYSSNASGSLGIIFEVAGANSQSVIISVVYPAAATSNNVVQNLVASTSQGLILYMGEQQEFGTLPTLSASYTGGGTHTSIGTSPENNSGGSGVPRLGYAGGISGTLKGTNTVTLSSTQTAYMSLSFLYLGNAV